MDSQGGYAHRDSQGGRPIVLAWQASSRERTSLTDAVPCDVVYYKPGLKDIQRQLVSEFAAALRQLERKYRDYAAPPATPRSCP